jgi:hypothetical protein
MAVACYLAELANVFGVPQCRVSDIERPSDVQVSTLKAYRAKLGYELVLTAGGPWRPSDNSS